MIELQHKYKARVWSLLYGYCFSCGHRHGYI